MATCSFRLSCSAFFFSSRRRHTRFDCDWSSDVCSSDLANERVAFERPIAKFQAVQHNLARLAGEVSAAMTAAYSAADAIARADKFDDVIFLEATAAKIRSAEAAQEGAAIAHQVHGAIGFTAEHILHRYTLRILSWRDDFGNESYWAAALGNRIAARGADEFWPLVAAC